MRRRELPANTQTTDEDRFTDHTIAILTRLNKGGEIKLNDVYVSPNVHFIVTSEIKDECPSDYHLTTDEMLKVYHIATKFGFTDTANKIMTAMLGAGNG